MDRNIAHLKCRIGEATASPGLRSTIRFKSIFTILLVAIVGSAYAPTLTAIYEINDDHHLIRLANSARIHKQLPERRSVWNTLKSEIYGRGRIAPEGTLVQIFHARSFASSPMVHRWYMLLMTLATSLILYAVGTRLTESNSCGFLFSLWIMICPAAGDVWPHLVRSETVGMLQLAIILWCITSRKLRLIANIVFVLHCFEKENFFLLAPALAWLEWTYAAECNLQRTCYWSTLAYLITGLLAGIAIFLGALAAGQSSHGGQSLSLNTAEMAEVLMSNDGIIARSTINAFYFLPSFLAVLQWYFRRNPIPKKLGIYFTFAALVVLPQIAIYLTRSSFEGRYAFPLIIGPVLLNTLAIKFLANSVKARSIRLLGFLFLALWFGRCWQVQILESYNFSVETQSINTLVHNTLKKVSSRGNILLISSSKSEHAAALLAFIGVSGRPDSNVFLYQPTGTDGDADYGFSGMQNPTPEQLSTVDAIIWAPGMDGKLPDTLSQHNFEDLAICFEKVYVSIRKMKLDRVPHRYYAAFKKQI